MQAKSGFTVASSLSWHGLRVGRQWAAVSGRVRRDDDRRHFTCRPDGKPAGSSGTGPAGPCPGRHCPVHSGRLRQTVMTLTLS